ncbi:hypothetical protein Nepgr_020670 [Nepenthes gracilis]|uniref:Ferredoxin n=1 Tax=Nepenthes gracilis TaxID=150966 RepID=A0AAD3SY18_NEPGR|nr:hypothetical protein Nepgr_020670 [Nepenthes gracilis]
MAAATLHFTTPPPFTLTIQKQPKRPTSSSPHLISCSRPLASRPTSSATALGAFKVVIDHDGQTTDLDVEPDETILSKALDSGLSVPHDCKLGVCMTCPAKLVSGAVDQSEGMLSDDVIERGYVLLCASYPRSDCRIRTIPEEELLSLQLATAND